MEENLDFNGVSYEFDRRVNVFDGHRHVVFSFDASVLQELEQHTALIMNSSCTMGTYKRNVDSFLRKNKEIREIMKLYQTLTPPSNSTNLYSFVNLNFLRKNLIDFMFGYSHDRCQTFRELVGSLVRVYVDLNKILSRNLDGILNILSSWELEEKVKSLIANNEHLILLRQGDFMFNFVTISDLSVSFYGSTLFLDFAAPVYRKEKVYRIKRKSVMVSNVSVMLRSDYSFVIFQLHRAIIFKEIDITRNCFNVNESTYCNRLGSGGICEEKYFAKENITNFDVKCFETVSNSQFKNTEPKVIGFGSLILVILCLFFLVLVTVSCKILREKERQIFRDEALFYIVNSM